MKQLSEARQEAQRLHARFSQHLQAMNTQLDPDDSGYLADAVSGYYGQIMDSSRVAQSAGDDLFDFVNASGRKGWDKHTRVGFVAGLAIRR